MVNHESISLDCLLYYCRCDGNSVSRVDHPLRLVVFSRFQANSTHSTSEGLSSKAQEYTRVLAKLECIASNSIKSLPPAIDQWHDVMNESWWIIEHISLFTTLRGIVSLYAQPCRKGMMLRVHHVCMKRDNTINGLNTCCNFLLCRIRWIMMVLDQKLLLAQRSFEYSTNQ